MKFTFALAKRTVFKVKSMDIIANKFLSNVI